MKKAVLFIAAAAVSACLCGCAERYDKGYYDEAYYESSVSCITLRNFSGEGTVWFIPESGLGESLPSSLSEWQKIGLYWVPGHSSYDVTFDSTDSYVTPIETYGADESMTFYVFKQNDFENHEWSDLVDGGMWVGKCTYSVAEIVELNGIVTYPMR